jgi:hypothetical protein
MQNHIDMMLMTGFGELFCAVTPRVLHLPITFNSLDLELRDYPHTDVVVIEINVVGWSIPKILVDTSSSTNILLSSTFNNMKFNRNLL